MPEDFTEDYFRFKNNICGYCGSALVWNASDEMMYCINEECRMYIKCKICGGARGYCYC